MTSTDEVQECREIVTRIKFLVDEGNYRYIMSGSLHGVELNDLRSAPVGYMRILDMYPVDFEEFVKAVGVQDSTVSLLKDCFQNRKTVDEFVHKKMLDIFYLYLIIGGMPEAVQIYLETNNEKRHKLKLQEIYDAMASELNSKSKRFHLNKLGTGMSYDRVVNDFLWLKDAGVALPVYNIKEPKLPLRMNENRSLFNRK